MILRGDDVADAMFTHIAHAVKTLKAVCDKEDAILRRQSREYLVAYLSEDDEKDN